MSNSTTPIVIGFAAKKRHGKNAAARLFRSIGMPRGYTVIERGFADALKEECARAIAEYHPTKNYVKILSEMYQDERKEEYRLLMQWWGTNFRRAQNSTYWLDRMDEWIGANAYNTPNTIICLTDVRFPNEVEFIKNNQRANHFTGHMVKILRTDLPPETDTHSSETALDGYTNWDATITNTVDPDDLERSLGWLKRDVDRVFHQITNPAFGVKNAHHSELVWEAWR